MKIDELFYEIDVFCRQNFRKNFIVSERDYVSLLLSFLKYPDGPFKNNRNVHSQTLDSHLEQKFGCDGIILFKQNDNYRIGMFEAKVYKYDFDALVGKLKNISRFQRQIEKQKTIPSKILVWEMFFNRDNIENYLDRRGSTCVKNDIAFTHKIKKIKWNFQDLKALLEMSFKSNSNKPVNFKQIIEELLSNNIYENQNPKSKIISFKDNKQLKIPIIKGEVNDEDVELIDSFLKENNIYSYTFIDVDSFE